MACRTAFREVWPATRGTDRSRGLTRFEVHFHDDVGHETPRRGAFPRFDLTVRLERRIVFHRCEPSEIPLKLPPAMTAHDGELGLGAPRQHREMQPPGVR